MGQVIVGEKKHGSNWPIPGMKFGYEFDGIGNRNSATVNGRTAAYTADVANQYDERQVPGALDIRGRASTTARVTVNTEPTQRLDEYFYKALAIDNSSAPQYSGVSVFAVRNNAGPSGEDIQSETTGNLFLAKTPEVFTHDAEGNLTSDGRWNCTWDGENRLIRQETVATIPTAAKRKLEFAYDAENRRNRKQVFNWNGAAWVLQKDLRFLYDGWNLIAELDATNTTQRNFVWGLDISRTPQGAGGVGGLLAIREGSESHLPAFDGNGNVMALVKASDQSISARYEYGPFGETLVVEENGVSNPFRFSTKYLDSETGLYNFIRRYYSPTTGRWLSRDPIQERGGVNFYGFVGNDGLNRIDVLGLYTFLLVVGEENGVPFTQAAQTKKKDIESSSIFDEKCDKVVIAQAGGAADFNRALEENKDIVQIYIFTHAGSGVLYLGTSGTGADTNITEKGGKHTIGYIPLISEGVTFETTGVSSLSKQNIRATGDNDSGRTADEPLRDLYVYGCDSAEIARSLGRHFGMDGGYGTSTTCYFPVIDDDGNVVPMDAVQYFFWLKFGIR